MNIALIMSKKMKLLLPAFSALVLLNGHAISPTYSALVTGQAEYEYETKNGVIHLIKYNGSGGAVYLPDKIDGLPVTSIEDYAFSGCTSLINIIIPSSITRMRGATFDLCRRLTKITVNASNSVYSSIDGVLFDKDQTTLIKYPMGKSGNIPFPPSVTKIGYMAFTDCYSLTNVTISNSVISIAARAFLGCDSLTDVTIPNSVTIIGREAFYECPSLITITVNGSNTTYSSVDGVLFNKDKTTLMQYPRGKAGYYIIPNIVTSIGEFAFAYNTNITSVTIPNSVTNIGYGSFLRCRSLTSVTIPKNCPDIGGMAFSDCNSLTNANIPNGVIRIRSMAFVNCNKLTRITIPSSVIDIGEGAFAGCTRLTGVYFQGSAPLLSMSVFLDSNNVKIYYLPGAKGWGKLYGGRLTAIWQP